MYAVCAVPKATREQRSILEQLVHAVRLENTTQYHSEPPVPEAIVLTPTPCRPVVQTCMEYTDIFDAVLDPAFNEDEFMASPPLPLGDHCTL